MNCLFSSRFIGNMSTLHTDLLSTVPSLNRRQKAALFHEQIANIEKTAFSAKPLSTSLHGNPREAWDSSLLGKNSNAALDVSARKWILSCVVCSSDQGFDDMLWLLAQWLLLVPAKARHINLRYPVLRSWA